MREKEFHNTLSLKEELKGSAAKEESIIDMESYLEKVPSIECVFSPKEEVEKLWSIPRQDRKEAVAEFKDKLARYIEAWAMCRTAIEERIEANPDMPKEEMNAIIKEFASNYGFSERHIEVAESLVDDYIEMHKKVAEVREKYANNADLVNHLTGLDFTKKDAKDFDISVSPMSVDIECNRFNTERIYQRDAGMPVANVDDNVDIGGFVSMSENELIYFMVINRDYMDENASTASIHEHEHLKNRLLQSKLDASKKVSSNLRRELNKGFRGFIKHLIMEKVFRFERNFEKELIEHSGAAVLSEKKDFFFKEYMKIKRSIAFDHVKDEMLASFKEGEHSPTFEYLLFWLFKKDNNSFDYLSDLRNIKYMENNKEWQKVSQEVLVDEYKTIIESAANAIYDIEEQGGYSRDIIIAMLADKKLENWPKVAKRLLEQKKEE